ncbi:MAG: hypothetical protein JOZ18_18820, partial [Chloroflexi bacterium]|nr:hypothetical protein [Chloroflexota bacterium]
MSEQVQSEKHEQAVVPSSDPLVRDTHAEHEEIEARSLYQHDPLFVLLKERWHLADYWILLGCAALPTLIYLLWLIWLLANPSTHLLTPKTIVSMLLQCIVIFPLLFLMYLRLPHWFAALFNKLRRDDVIGKPRPGSHGPSSYARFVQLVTLWTDKWWWAAGAIALNVVYLSFRLSFVEIPAAIPTPLWLRCLALLVYTPLMYAAFLSIARIVAAFVALNGLL